MLCEHLFVRQRKRCSQRHPTIKETALNPEKSSIGNLTRLFMVLLRLAIGWHFLYEGASKLETYIESRAAGPQWSAEGYLRNSAGPLAPYFRRLLDDPDGVERLRLSGDAKAVLPPRLEMELDSVHAVFSSVSNLTEKQKQQGEEKLAAIKKKAAEWLPQIQFYLHDYATAAKVHWESEGRTRPDFEQDRFYGDRLRGLQTQRNFLAGKIEEWTATLENDLQSLLTPSQCDEKREKLGKPTLLNWGRIMEWPAWWKPIDWVNFATIYGLIAMGLCLMFGFLTRLAALGAVVFLASLYLAMPPWPGLPGATAMNGHYFFVNFQLIEALAVLAVAGSGRWAGIDALLHGCCGGRKANPQTQSSTGLKT